MTRSDERAKGICEFRIAVMDEVSAALEDAPFVHGDIPGDLLHPGFIGMWRDPSDLDATALEMDKEQHVLGDQAAQCEHFHGKEVGSSEYRHVGTNEVYTVGHIMSLVIPFPDDSVIPLPKHRGAVQRSGRATVSQYRAGSETEVALPSSRYPYTGSSCTARQSPGSPKG